MANQNPAQLVKRHPPSNSGLRRSTLKLLLCVVLAVISNVAAAQVSVLETAPTIAESFVNETGYLYSARVLACTPTGNAECPDVSDQDRWHSIWKDRGSAIVVDNRGYVLTAGHVLHEKSGLTERDPNIVAYRNDSWKLCMKDYDAPYPAGDTSKLHGGEIRVVLDDTPPNSKNEPNPRPFSAKEVGVMYHREGVYDVALLEIDNRSAFSDFAGEANAVHFGFSRSSERATQLFMGFPYDGILLRNAAMHHTELSRATRGSRDSAIMSRGTPGTVGQMQYGDGRSAAKRGDGQAPGVMSMREQREALAIRGNSGAGLIFFHDPNLFYVSGILQGGAPHLDGFSWLACVYKLVSREVCRQSVVFTSFDQEHSRILWPLFSSIPPSESVCQLIESILDPNVNLNSEIRKFNKSNPTDFELISLFDFFLDNESRKNFYSTRFTPDNDSISLRTIIPPKGASGSAIKLSARLYPCRTLLYNKLKRFSTAEYALRDAFTRSEKKGGNSKSNRCDSESSIYAQTDDQRASSNSNTSAGDQSSLSDDFTDAVFRAANGRTALFRYDQLRNVGSSNPEKNINLLLIALSELDKALTFFEQSDQYTATNIQWTSYMNLYGHAVGEEENWARDGVWKRKTDFQSALYAYKAYALKIANDGSIDQNISEKISSLIARSLELDQDNALALTMAGDELYKRQYLPDGIQLAAYASTRARGEETEEDWLDWPAVKSDSFAQYVADRSTHIKGMSDPLRLAVGENALLEDSLGTYIALNNTQ